MTGSGSIATIAFTGQTLEQTPQPEQVSVSITNWSTPKTILFVGQMLTQSSQLVQAAVMRFCGMLHLLRACFCSHFFDEFEVESGFL